VNHNLETFLELMSINYYNQKNTLVGSEFFERIERYKNRVLLSSERGSNDSEMSKEKIKKIFERLPLAERKMPAVIIDGKVFTWEEAWLEIRDDKPLAKKIQEKIEEINKNEK